MSLCVCGSLCLVLRQRVLGTVPSTDARARYYCPLPGTKGGLENLSQFLTKRLVRHVAMLLRVALYHRMLYAPTRSPLS